MTAIELLLSDIGIQALKIMVNRNYNFIHIWPKLLKFCKQDIVRILSQTPLAKDNWENWHQSISSAWRSRQSQRNVQHSNCVKNLDWYRNLFNSGDIVYQLHIILHHMSMLLVCLICKYDHHQQILVFHIHFIQDKQFLNLVMVFHIQHFNYSWYNDSKNSIASIKSLSKNNYDEKTVLLHLYRVNVTNTGPVPGDYVVLAYFTPPNKSMNVQSN